MSIGIAVLGALVALVAFLGALRHEENGIVLPIVGLIGAIILAFGAYGMGREKGRSEAHIEQVPIDTGGVFAVANISNAFRFRLKAPVYSLGSTSARNGAMELAKRAEASGHCAGPDRAAGEKDFIRVFTTWTSLRQASAIDIIDPGAATASQSGSDYFVNVSGKSIGPFSDSGERNELLALVNDAHELTTASERASIKVDTGSALTRIETPLPDPVDYRMPCP